MNSTIFGTLLAAATAKVEVPIDGSTGVWLKLGSNTISSGMSVTYTSTSQK